MKLPRAVPSPLGPVPVIEADAAAAETEFGSFDYRARVIKLNRACTDVMLLATLGHEITHMALYDAGTANFLDEKTTEAVCDAIGLWFGGAVLAGFLRVDANWRPQ